METKKIILTIIIPIYNVKQYLVNCLDSILKQDTSNVEIILIDDGSTDNSGLICDTYEAKFENVKTYHKSNGGLSDARNFGLMRAHGVYVHFFDSDDLAAPNYLYDVKNLLYKENLDLLHINYKIFQDGEQFTKENSQIEKQVSNVSTTNMLCKLLKRNIENYTWSFVIRKSILTKNAIQFPKNRIYEDVATTYLIISKSSTIKELNSVCYFYRTRGNSIAQTASYKSVVDVLQSLKEMDQYIASYDNDVYQKYFGNFLLAFLLFSYYETYRAINDHSKRNNELRKIKRSTIKCYKKHRSGYIRTRYLIAYILIRLNLFNLVQTIRTRFLN